ncbi:hypothetical protein RvY_08719-2 [Ramazzottius varieornatus]|uniref:Uncharacterized protein n=1 Tax=Ramazzottius varieornatus TaxID=947166 RepID=A0A1D1V6W8_RAMVA|nr:hypothetical protein RvY_08719-2 [Ramazzottius varieornatus]
MKKTASSDASCLRRKILTGRWESRSPSTRLYSKPLRCRSLRSVVWLRSRMRALEAEVCTVEVPKTAHWSVADYPNTSYQIFLQHKAKCLISSIHYPYSHKSNAFKIFHWPTTTERPILSFAFHSSSSGSMVRCKTAAFLHRSDSNEEPLRSGRRYSVPASDGYGACAVATLLQCYRIAALVVEAILIIVALSLLC